MARCDALKRGKQLIWKGFPNGFIRMGICICRGFHRFFAGIGSGGCIRLRPDQRNCHSRYSEEQNSKKKTLLHVARFRCLTQQAPEMLQENKPSSQIFLAASSDCQKSVVKRAPYRVRIGMGVAGKSRIDASIKIYLQKLVV